MCPGLLQSICQYSGAGETGSQAVKIAEPPRIRTATSTAAHRRTPLGLGTTDQLVPFHDSMSVQ